MDAVKYLEEKYRMTNDCLINCNDCLISYVNNGYEVDYSTLEKEYPEKAVAIIECWSDSHPQKTILDDFKEKYPNYTPISDTDDTPDICCIRLGYECNESSCYDDESCKHAWNQPLNKKGNK